MNLFQRLIKKPDARPIKFPQVNFTYTKPAEMTKEECGDLPCFRSENRTISCWEFSWRDRLRFLWTGKMWLMLISSGHPPVCLTPDDLFTKATTAKPISALMWVIVLTVLNVIGAVAITLLLIK